MFKFLKLHSSSSGDARRLVPFTSIIHKHILPVFFITILFLTLFFRPYAAEALAQLTPEIQPVYDTTIESLYEFIKVQLDDTHKQVFDLLLGSYMVGYAGMSDYQLSYAYNSETPVKEWLINSGADLYNTILSLGGIPPEGSSTSILPGVNVPNIGYQQLSPLLQYAMGCAIKSKSYSSADDCINDILNSDAYPIPLKPDIMFSINAAMGYYESLYDWQFNIKPFKSNTAYINVNGISGTNLDNYNNYVASMPIPKVRVNKTDGSSGVIISNSDFFNQYCYLFINSSDNTVYLVDQNGLIPQSTSIRSTNYIYVYNGSESHNSYMGIYKYLIYYKSFNPNDYNTYNELVQDIYDGVFLLGSSNYLIFYEDFIKGVFVGSSWSNKSELTNETNLNLERPNKPTFLQGVENGLLDLKGLLEDIIGELELRPPVINNYYYPDGSNVPVADIEPAMQNNTVPESGVDIDQNLFAPLFTSDGKKSYISYLWYMTKPLVLYTKDLFNCLVFDPVADFVASGPGYFVYGVVGLGLISGLLVKCLL